MMSFKHKILICLIALVLAVSIVPAVSANSNSLLEFFGFGDPEETATPAPEQEPFLEFDPALVEPDEPAVESKNSDAWFDEDDWDLDAYSFSEETDDEDPEGIQQKDAGQMIVPGYIPQNNPQTPPQMQNWNNGPDEIWINLPPNQVPSPTPSPTPIFYRFPNFCHNCRLPCTGFPTNRPVKVNESIQYAQTNMTLSIPTLNVNEDIVLVPYVDDSFPVENLGSNIGLLEGSGPSENDLFVLAGHNHLNTMEKGPFAGLSAMKVSDLIFIRGSKNAARTFVVYANEKFAADDIDGLMSYARSGSMVLITCEDESIEGGYLNRRVIFAEAKEE